MIRKTLALAAALLLSTQVHAQTNQNSTGPAQGTTSGPGVRLATSMRSPQAGRSARDQAPPEEVREQSQSVRNKAHQAACNNNDETGATGSSSPRYAPAPR